MALHRLTALALASVLTLGVSACGDDGPPKTAPSTTAATASSSPTGPVAPVLPELAKRQDAVGAKAFVRFYFAAVTYAMKTGDTQLMDDYSATDCETCRGISKKVTRIYSADGQNKGGGWHVGRLAYMTDSTVSLAHMTVSVTQPAQRLVDRDGKVWQRDPKTRFLFNVWASPDGGSWRLREIQTVSGGK